MGLGQYGLIAALTLFFILLGCFLDGISVVLLTTSIIMPMVQAAGIDLMWFGIYLVLITTNCIILAVPLLNATNDATFVEGIGLALGSGLGFALALFLMSCARERVELAPVPPVFRGLPISFIIAGLFAMAFLGFSGLSFF